MDSKGKYAELTASFMLTTTDLPAAFDGKKNKLIAAEGFTAEQLEAYIKNISTVVVNEKEYSASGRRAKVIIKEDGTLDTESDVFAEGESFNITVKAKGYENDLVFTYPEKSEEPEEYALGDVNGNTKIDITDLVQTAAHVKGKRLLDEKGRKAADINNDGKINVADIARIAAHIKGKKLIK
jgi:hypothetical protein